MAVNQFPRSAVPPQQSPKYWVKEKDRYLRQLLINDIEAKQADFLIQTPGGIVDAAPPFISQSLFVGGS